MEVPYESSDAKKRLLLVVQLVVVVPALAARKLHMKVSVMAPYRAAARMMMPQNRHIKHLLWTLWIVSPSMISIARANWF